jgi:hypothetical protein
MPHGRQYLFPKDIAYFQQERGFDGDTQNRPKRRSEGGKGLTGYSRDRKTSGTAQKCGVTITQGPKPENVFLEKTEVFSRQGKAHGMI